MDKNSEYRIILYNELSNTQIFYFQDNLQLLKKEKANPNKVDKD